jgi:MOSC domain-containing protein YiiM
VPKAAAARATVTATGLVGDRQNDLDHHGGGDRAVCLYSLELIQALQREGHPIFPGSTGENLTIAGLDWPSLAPGVRLRVGAKVELEIVKPTTPCAKIAPSFLAGDFDRISAKSNSGWSRFYARVITPGDIAIGSEVRVVALA